MAPKTRSSTSADQYKSDPDSNVSIESNSSLTPSTVDDNNILTKVLTSIKATNDSIKANQAAIEAIQLKLESHSTSIDCQDGNYSTRLTPRIFRNLGYDFY